MNGSFFSAPEWLWGIPVVFALYVFLLFGEKRRKARFRFYASPEAWPNIAPELNWRARPRKCHFWVLGLFFLILALALYPLLDSRKIIIENL